VTISAVAVQNKQFLQTSEALKVDINARKLKIDVVADKTQYLPGETATYSIKAVGPNGKPVATDLSLAVVDEAIYAIREDHTDPVKAFYPARPNVVDTNYSFPELYLDGGDKGGEIKVRMNFKDTAAWMPSIKTDASGQASVQVKMPDNLTKWRATVVGVSDSTDVGLAKNDVVVAKPLMIRLQAPKFMVKGDRQEVVAIVNNNSGRDATVHVTFEPAGFSTRDNLNRTVRVDNGKAESVEWDLTAATTGQGTLVAKAWIDQGPSDGLQQLIQIKPHAREVNYRMAGEIRGSTEMSLALRDDADPSVGQLKISLSPTIATSVYASLDELIDYPYGCVEQTMSRFLPAMILAKPLGKTGLLRPDLAKRIPKIAKQSIAKLKDMHHGDGGWGWWENDSSTPFMTAYVLDGLKRAEDAGYTVDPNLTESALDWAQGKIGTEESRSWQKRAHLYLAYTLALHGRNDKAAAMLKEVDLTNAGPASLATAALTHNLLGVDHVQARDNLMQRLRDKVDETTTTASWGPESESHYWWDTEDVYGAETTALPLLALEAIAPDDPLILKGIRGLLLSRRGAWWWSTRDTSFALMAIGWYIEREQPHPGTSTVSVTINGKPAGQVQMDLRQMLGVDPSLRIPLTQMQRGLNKIELKVSGANLAYYSLDYKQYVEAPRLGKLINGSGFTLERTYHLLKSEQQEDGTYRLAPSKDPISRAKSGDLIQVSLVLKSDRKRNYIMLEDPVPSNCRIAEDNDISDEYGWSYWYSGRTVYDDRITFFARELEAGTQTFTYVMRAESPGVSRALPPVADNMYNPDDRTSNSELELEVRP
jgi:uncharacterized protein YfaS (alpha-2-macroglobulin family)